MADKKNSEKKEEMIKVNLAEIDRKRMEYRWGMESFFRNHKIEAENYKEALERYRESCLVLMPESDIKKIEDTKKIKVKRIPFINLHKIRREKPLGRWQASACFKNCEINENRYKKELEAYNQACRLQMKPKEMEMIAEKLQCRVSELAISDSIVDLSEIRRRLEEKTLKEFFVECGIDISKYDDEFHNKANSLRLQMTLKDVKKIAEILQCEVTKILNSDNQVNLSEIKERIKDKTVKEFLDECKIDINKYEDDIYKQARKWIVKKLECEEKDILDTDNKVNLFEIKKRIEAKTVKKIFVERGIDINKYEDDIYKQAKKLQMDDKDREVIIGKFRNPVIKKFLNLEESKIKVKLSKLRNQPEVKTLKEFLNEKKVDIGKYEGILYADTILMDVKDTEKIIEKLQCKAEEVLELKSSEFIVEISKLKQQIEEKKLIKKEALENFYSVFRSSEEEWEQELLECEKRFFIAKSFFKKCTIKMDRYEEEIYNQIYMLNISLEDAEKLQYKFSNMDVSEVVDLFELKQRMEENAIKRFFTEYKIKGYDQAIQAYEKSGFIKAEKADIKKIEQNMKLQENKFIENAVDLSDIQRRLKVHEPGDIEQNLKDYGIEIQKYEEDLKTYEEASYLTMEEDDIEKLAKSLQCKREEIEIKQKSVNLLQVEAKIEKIAREKWSTLEDFFESIGVNRDYQKEIEQYENQHFIECNKNLFDKLVEGFECGEKDLLFVGNKGGNQEIYKVKIVELERRKKTKDGEWRESLYDTLKVKKILDGVSKEESNRIKGDIKKFAADSFIDMDEYDCKKISNSINCEMVEIINGEIPVDLRKIPGLDMGNTSHPTKILGLTSSYKIENSGFSGKIKEASEKGFHCVNMKLSTANQIAKSSGYKLEDLQASAFDIAKEEVKKKLLPFARQVKMDVLCELFMLEYEQWLWENSRIEYLKTESGYNVTIFFYGEKYEIGDLPKTDQEEDVEQYLADELEKCLSDGYPDELYALFSELPIVEVEERKNEHPFFCGKCEQLLNRMDADGESLENKLRVLRNEMPFTQDMCDYYEIPNPFDIEE